MSRPGHNLAVIQKLYHFFTFSLPELRAGVVSPGATVLQAELKELPKLVLTPRNREGGEGRSRPGRAER